MDEAGNQKDDLSLPKGTDDSEKLAAQIQEDFDAGKELVLTVLMVRRRSWQLFMEGATCFARGLVLCLLQHYRNTFWGCPAQSMGEEMVNACKSAAGAEKA